MAEITVLVTGATGFLGAHLCRALLERGYRVRAFHRPTSSPRLLSGLEVEHATGDLTQPESLAAALEGVQTVFHTAAWMGGRDPTGQQYAVTVEGTRNVLQQARRAGVERLVYTSSFAALGVPAPGAGHASPPPRGMWVDENHTWNFRPDFSAFGYAKYLAEQEVQRAVAQGLDAVIVNPGLIFGRGDIYRSASSLINLVAERRLTVATTGGVNCVHIDDVVDGHMAALAAGRTGERYILGGYNLTHLQLLQTIAGITGVPEPTTVVPPGLLRGLVGPANLLRSYLRLPFSPDLLRLAGYYFYFNTHKMESELGITKPRPITDAILEAYTWFRAAPV